MGKPRRGATAQRSREVGCGEPSRPQFRPIELKAAGTRREVADEVDRYKLTDDGQLLLEADEVYLNAIRLDPACSPMRVPTLLTGGTIGELNGNGEEILDRKTHAGCIAQRKSRR